jgi:hypothetical protein
MGTIPALKVRPKTSAAISLVPCIADAIGLTAVGGTTKLAPSPPNTKGTSIFLVAFKTEIIVDAPTILTSLYLLSSIAIVDPFMSEITINQSSGAG